MSDPEQVQLDFGAGGGDGVKLFLWRKRKDGCPPVLLLHGASACHETFAVPPATNLVDWLHGRGFEPWLLDWRGSGLVVDEARKNATLEKLRDRFDFDHAARCDIPAALRTIRNETRSGSISAVGHCMGAATLAQAIAEGLAGPKTGLTHVVLLTLGLFYEPAWDGRLKSQDHVLERLWCTGGLEVDPRPPKAWQRELREIYDNWPSSLRPHPDRRRSAMERMCNRVSFMYGPPYLEANLGPEIHSDGFLESQFGAIPLRMYIHGAQNVRRGWAAKFNAPNDDTELIRPEARRHFDALRSVTLMTGARNQLWHRDSIDRMYEWLKRGPDSGRIRPKVILPQYAHQDLLWGEKAPEAVFREIEKGLPPPGRKPA